MKNFGGVTFNFDESVLLEDRKLQIPLNFYKTSHNFTTQFKLQLIQSNTTQNIIINTVNTGVKDVTDQSVRFGYLDSKELEELIDENCLATKNVYNSVINETINEFQRLELIEKQKLERENLEKQRLEQEKLQNQINQKVIQPEKLTSQPEKISLQGEKISLHGEKSINVTDSVGDLWDYIPKNKTILIFDEMKEKFIKFERIYAEVKSNSDLKQIRIDLSKRVKICLNSIANTQKQVDLTFKTLSSLLHQCQSDELKIFILFKIVEGVLNCCEQGQIYINPKSVWSFSRLLASIDKINPDFNTIFITLLTLKTKLIIPKFYLHKNNIPNDTTQNITNLMTHNMINNMSGEVDLGKLYEYPLENANEEIVYNKRLSSYIRLYLSYLCIKNDFTTIWSYYANVVNSSWSSIFIQFIPCILITILNITSYFMYNIYKLQFKKVLKNINKLLNEKLMKCNNTSSIQMYIGQLQQFYHDFKYLRYGACIKSNRFSTHSGVKLAEPEGYKMKYKEEDLRNDI